jgi:hypothetical protein
MKNSSRIALSIISSSILTISAWALPARTASSAPHQSAAPSPAQLQSATGKIASVQTSSFTLETAAAMPQGQQFQQQAKPTTMTFQIDQNTAVSGKLAVGSSADVTYRVDNGNNVAVNVQVTP